jgi:formate dehydrogenase major subunit
MMDAASAGSLSALWVCGYDIYLTLAHAEATARALASLELVIVQDLFLNKTAERFGHIFLPAASGFEKDGTFMNSDRRVQRVRAALSPRGQSKPDSWIIAEVAGRLGFGKHFAHPSAEAIWDEIRSVWPGGAGLAYPRLEQHPPHWPCLDEQHPGTPILHESRFVKGVRAERRPIAIVDSPEIVDDMFPFLLTTGRHLYQFNAGTMTQRTANVELRARDELEISPEDAASFDLSNGDWVAVESRHGHCELPIRIAERIKPSELFTTFHDPASFVNRVTSFVRDRIVHAPEYKFTAVKINKIPRRNHAPHA